MRQVARRVSDGSVLKLIKAWLRAPIVEEDGAGRKRVIPNRCGTPQGGVISPLLANIYLNGLDHGVNERCKSWAEMHRYADDFVICCRPGSSGEVLARLKRWLEVKGLKLNETKTRVVNIRSEGLDFLDFNITWRLSWRGRYYPHVEPSSKSQRELRRKLREHLNHWTLWRPVRDNVSRVNRLLRGWAGYFHYRNSSAVMDEAMTYARDRLRRWVGENTHAHEGYGNTTRTPACTISTDSMKCRLQRDGKRSDERTRRAGYGKSVRPVR